jgi:hypothetical protein
MNYFCQGDVRWRDIEMVKGVKIGEFGCLLTSISNALCKYQVKYQDYLSPDILNMIVQNNNGYTANGLLLWKFLEDFFFFRHKNIGKQDPVQSEDKQFIIHLPFQNTGHFCNLLDFSGELYSYFDVYDGEVKTAPRSKVISCRQLQFYGRG